MKVGMTKVTVLYPNSEGKHFDINYYVNKHVPMVSNLLGDALKYAEIEEGIGTAEPGADAPYAAIGCIYFNSVEDFQTSFGANAEQIMGDIPNYTNIEPIIQISEVKL
ncbi:EthD family reductase [Yeosuana sp. MJ-SS3]|uniref:EthD family reductase n=1 Tax=Gilvirhabdus luticola TaxID=3079858 RepID=A0ABU3U5B9_9FLAO|nr:EthD family reductase [Yeosuana sp. MJ-SS3]MDU8885521.1 EthD family reductase [Yeosuana sp. MJ-SS3]